jgi:non-specific serine/threonine protein kinase/serine/threonine-protein kinase
MARVFDAFDERLERPVAVKVLRPETEALPGMRERFQQEARLAARLVHPNIVAVLDYGEAGASSYLVMERLPGSTLRDEIARGPVPPVRLVPILTETLAALAAAHKFGVLHRDIKPSNILLQDDGHAKITDFGIAKSFDGPLALHPATKDLTMTGVVLGTPGYLAPERRVGQPATVQSDLYSVGAVMVEALTGHQVLPGIGLDPQVPPPLRDIAAHALASDPRDRYPSADAMIEALRTLGRPDRNTAPQAAAVGMAPTTEFAASPPPVRNGTALLHEPLVAPPRQKRRRWRLWFPLAALAAATVALLALFLVDRNAPSVPTANAASHHTASGRHAPTADSAGAAIRQAASSLAGQGQPGDATLAAALDATAAQSPGPGRRAAADQTLVLAQVLLAGGGITYGQYQDVVSVLGPTGATVPTTTVPPTTVPPTAPRSPAGAPPAHGHGHGGGQGDQG